MHHRPRPGVSGVHITLDPRPPRNPSPTKDIRTGGTDWPVSDMTLRALARDAPSCSSAMDFAAVSDLS
jgi:hypothetical protein